MDYDIIHANHIVAKALKKYKPSKAEEKALNSKIALFLKRLNKHLEALNAVAVLGGSAAKGTWLKNPDDADIFVLFDYAKYSEESQNLSPYLELAIKKLKMKYLRVHGSRDYFQIVKAGFKFELIPVLKLSRARDAKNITDVSPLHATWVKRSIKSSRNPTIADEIRLMKVFCRANGLYGAESYIAGFSGYVCEILTIFYGSFLNVLEGSLTWKDNGKETIDPENFYKEKSIVEELNSSKTISPLILVDPVQSDRNAAAALSREKYLAFKQTAFDFLKDASMARFEKKKLTAGYFKELSLENKDSYVFVIDAVGQEGKEDVIGCQLLKVFEHIGLRINENDFKLVSSGWNFDRVSKAKMWFVVSSVQLSPLKIQMGPPLEKKKDILRFREKHDVTFEQDRRLYAEVPRKFIKPEELLKYIVSEDPLIKENMSKVKLAILLEGKKKR